MRRATTLLLVLLILSVGPMPSSSAATIDGAGVVIAYEPASLTLRSGEWGRVQLDVENTGDRTLYFEVHAWGVETRGGAWTEVNPEGFKLDPGERSEVAIDVRSRARIGQDDGMSDVHIAIYHGTDAKVRDDGSYGVNGPHEIEDVYLDVIDGYPITGTGQDAGVLLVILVIAIVLVAVAVAAVVVVRRKGRARRADPPH